MLFNFTSVTIDTIYELGNSQVRCGGWGEPEKEFFTSSFDVDLHKIGLKFETVSSASQAIQRVAEGKFAYYENKFFLLDGITRHWDQLENTTKGSFTQNIPRN